MTGKSPKVDHIRKAFVRSIESAESLYQSVRGLEGINPASRQRSLHSKHVRRVVELAFMGVVAEWEEFLEQTLVRYMAGARCDNGYAPKIRLGYADSITHAYQLIAHDPKYDPSRGFIALSSSKATLDLATLFFENGEPYKSALAVKRDRLADAVHLRNRIAHSSTKVRQDFKQTALRFLNRGEDGKLSQGYRVGDLLLTEAERHFGEDVAQREITFFQAFMEMFTELSQNIVPED